MPESARFQSRLELARGRREHFRVVFESYRYTCGREIRGEMERAIERYGALHLAANLASTGVPVRLEHKNAKVFTPPAREFEARLKARRLRHTGSSFLTWGVLNCCIQRRKDGSLLPQKDAPMSPNKIDGVDALCLALSGMLWASTIEQPEPRIFFWRRR